MQTALRTLLALALCLALPMCKTPELAEPVAVQGPHATKERQDQLKRLFAKALVRVLADEQGARQLIKTEALKQFDHDYDVLYHMVKNQPVRSDGLTFRQAIRHALPPEPSAGDPVARTLPLLEEIERDLPLLTILVPELPENSFSAEKWDVAAEIPIVAIRVWAEQGVPYVACNGEEDYIPFKYTPGFPVVVVKDNERVTTAQEPGELTFKASGTDFYFRFTDRNFVNATESKKNKSGRLARDLDMKLIEARNTMVMNQVTDGWQRDYIYYDLTLTNDRGAFRYDFRETLTSLRFNVGQEALDKISDQRDRPSSGGLPDNVPAPIGQNNTNTPTSAAWTDGGFEFGVNAIINSKTPGISEIDPKFPARGDQLFDVEYQLIFWNHCVWYKGCIGQSLAVFIPKTVTPKTYEPRDMISHQFMVQMHKWDLYNYAPEMLVKIREIDLAQEIKDVKETTSEYAANFSIDGGVLKKIGLKLGASMKQTSKGERTITTSVDSDDLGNIPVYFADKVIVHEILGMGLYRTQEYPTSWVTFSIEPLRVQ